MDVVGAAWNRNTVFALAGLLRLALLIYGHHQDAASSLKYTDIDYYVFTDAARNIYKGLSPYNRDTYRYTPLLAWLLAPTALGGWWFDYGKVIFALADLLAGWLIILILRGTYRLSESKSLAYASLWLLNPMVATISTRGSSEGLLAVMVISLLWATLERRLELTGALLGLAVHFKIYPFIYALSIILWLATQTAQQSRKINLPIPHFLIQLITPASITVTLWSAGVFCALNVVMYILYGDDFLNNTFLYHFVRTDHRHNFALHNLLLYYNSSPAREDGLQVERIAFIPQLLLSALWIPFSLARTDLPSCMLAQTLAFVAFNKVCTSQVRLSWVMKLYRRSYFTKYFLWYLVFLPFYLPGSSLVSQPKFGAFALCLWILGQALWLQQGYSLEFLGQTAFLPGLWLANQVFFIINSWILGIVISDVRTSGSLLPSEWKKTQ